jgi:hypothetical protein
LELSVLGDVFALSPELLINSPMAAAVWMLSPFLFMLLLDKDWLLAPLPVLPEQLMLPELLLGWCYRCDFELA